MTSGSEIRELLNSVLGFVDRTIFLSTACEPESSIRYHAEKANRQYAKRIWVQRYNMAYLVQSAFRSMNCELVFISAGIGEAWTRLRMSSF